MRPGFLRETINPDSYQIYGLNNNKFLAETNCTDKIRKIILNDLAAQNAMLHQDHKDKLSINTGVVKNCFSGKQLSSGVGDLTSKSIKQNIGNLMELTQDNPGTSAEAKNQDWHTILPTISKERLAKMQNECINLHPIIEYLSFNTLPVNKKAARKVLYQVQSMFLKDGILYRKNNRKPRKSKKQNLQTSGDIQVVIPDAMRFEILKTAHDDDCHCDK